MTPWTRGRNRIDDLIAAQKVTRLDGASAGVDDHMSRANQQLRSARLLLDTDPVTAYVVAYDAVRHVAVALLAEQDLRASAQGGHLAVSKAIQAQFGGLFSTGKSRPPIDHRRNVTDQGGWDETDWRPG